MERVEQRRLGPRHPCLPPGGEAIEQRGAAHRVEVRGDFVEEQDRAAAGSLRDEIGVRQDNRRDAPPGPMVVSVAPLCYATVKTDKGEVSVAFYYDVAPTTVASDDTRLSGV